MAAAGHTQQQGGGLQPGTGRPRPLVGAGGSCWQGPGPLGAGYGQAPPGTSRPLGLVSCAYGLKCPRWAAPSEAVS